jgi:hypothetical protein
MTPLSHNQYIKLFSDIAIAHRSINSYHVGDLDNYTANQNDALNPVTLWVIVNDDIIEGKVDKPKYSFVVLDYVNQDSSNLDEVLSDTLRISKDVVAMLRQPYYETFFKLEESVTFNPFNEKFDSDVAGWQFDLIFNQSFLYDACEVNTTGLPSINYETISINTSNSTWGYIVGTLSNQTDLQNALNAKQATLVSGTNIKTVNGNTLLGSGDLTIAGGGETLAQTLALGNTSGAFNLIMNDDQSLILGSSSVGLLKYVSATQRVSLSNSNGANSVDLTDMGAILLAGTSLNIDHLTASTVPYIDAGKDLVSSAVTPTELGYVSGVTSAIQTQLNAKQDTLVSATNIKTVGGVSLLGAGDIGSISTSYTDAKIKGAIAATAGLIPYGNGTADTVTTNANFVFDSTNVGLIVGETALGASTDVARFQKNQNAATALRIYNTTSGTAAQTFLQLLDGTDAFNFGFTNTSFTPSGAITAKTAYLQGTGTGGLVLQAINASGAIQLTTGGATVRASISSGGFINLGNYASPTAQRIVTIGQDTAFCSIGSRISNTSQTAFYQQATPSSSNWFLRTDGTDVALNGTSGNVSLQTNNTNRYVIATTTGSHTWTTANASGSATTYFNFTAGNSTTQTASTAIPKFSFNPGTCQWATGAITDQKSFVFNTPTFSFVGASTITNGYNVYIEGVTAGTNAIITNPYALGVNGVSNFLGNVRLTQTVTSEVVVSDTTVTIVINGTTYKLLAKA